MKKTAILAVLSLIASFAVQAKAPQLEDWQNPAVFEKNRMPMRAGFTVDQQQSISLNGVWKFFWNATIDGRLRGFESPSTIRRGVPCLSPACGN